MPCKPGTLSFCMIAKNIAKNEDAGYFLERHNHARAEFDRALALKPGYPEAQSFLQRIDEQERLR